LDGVAGVGAVFTRCPPVGLRTQSLEALDGGVVEAGGIGREIGAVGVDAAVHQIDAVLVRRFLCRQVKTVFGVRGVVGDDVIDRVAHPLCLRHAHG